jgi:hypothetical protein
MQTGIQTGSSTKVDKEAGSRDTHQLDRDENFLRKSAHQLQHSFLKLSLSGLEKSKI